MWEKKKRNAWLLGGQMQKSRLNYQYFIQNISEVLQCRHKLIRWMASSLPPFFSSALRQPITPALCAESQRKRHPLAFTLRPPRLPSAALIPTSSGISVQQTWRARAPPTASVPERLLMLTRSKRNTKKNIKKKCTKIKVTFENSAGMGQGAAILQGRAMGD